MKVFHDNQHANNRLNRCFIAFKEDGVWGVSRCIEANLKYISLENGKSFRLDSDDVIVVFPELGYIDTRHQTAYLSRSSVRMWKAGLVPENVKIEHFNTGFFMNTEPNISIYKALKQIVSHSYLSYEKAVDAVYGGLAAARAFDNRWCVGLTQNSEHAGLFYRGKLVGYVDKQHNPFVGGAFKSLEERFIEITGREFIL